MRQLKQPQNIPFLLYFLKQIPKYTKYRQIEISEYVVEPNITVKKENII